MSSDIHIVKYSSKIIVSLYTKFNLKSKVSYLVLFSIKFSIS